MNWLSWVVINSRLPWRLIWPDRAPREVTQVHVESGIAEWYTFGTISLLQMIVGAQHTHFVTRHFSAASER